ncbi:MAG: GNAT family N-acetyltransferase [Mycoplasmatales bacterium]
MNLTIEKAQGNEDVASLILSAAECVFNDYQLPDNYECCTYLFGKRKNKFSFENTYLLMKDILPSEEGSESAKEIVGIFIIYPQKEEELLALNQCELIKQKYAKDVLVCNFEAVEDTFYLDTFAIKEEYQGQGLGKILLNKVIERFSNVSLLVDQPNARKLYEKMGFVEVNSLEVFGSKFAQMVYYQQLS